MMTKEQFREMLLEIKNALWVIDIPSPTVPEYIEHHEGVQKVMDLVGRKLDIMDASDGVDPELVRCKNCAHWIKETYQMCERSFPGDYCSRAVKREEKDDERG